MEADKEAFIAPNAAALAAACTEMPSLPEVSTTLCIVDSETAFAVPTLFPPFLAITCVAVLTKPSLTNAVACRGFTPVSTLGRVLH